jgi:hypothetical protein
MSLFVPVQAQCMACGTVVPTNLSASVNADRRPDLRQAILDGTFQAMTCGTCGVAVRLPAHLTYIDIGRRQWILVEDASRLPQWRESEAEAQALYDESFGPAAPPIQQMLAEGMKPRLVFGWAALREKLLAQTAGLDDVVLELLKISVLRNVPGSPLGDTTELRLISATDTELSLRWIDGATEEGIADLPLDRALYDDLAAELGPWEALRTDITAGLFVDMKRILLG